jgi:hypothetical protein
MNFGHSMVAMIGVMRRGMKILLYRTMAPSWGTIKPVSNKSVKETSAINMTTESLYGLVVYLKNQKKTNSQMNRISRALIK